MQGEDEADRPIRLFIGARVSLGTVRSLERAVQDLRRATGPLGLRWVAPATYHITIKFLGWSRRPVVEGLRDRVGVALAGAPELEIEVRGLGAFPAPDRARVLWAGVDRAGSTRLADLAARVESATAELGFAREQRPYHAHVTLARLRGARDLGALLERPEQAYRSSWIDSLILFESRQVSRGSEYRPLVSWPLEPAERDPVRHTRTVEPDLEDGPATDPPRSGDTGDGQQ